MDETLTPAAAVTEEQDRRISQTVAREESRLRAVIRGRVAYELVEAVRLMTRSCTCAGHGVPPLSPAPMPLDLGCVVAKRCRPVRSVMSLLTHLRN